MSGINEIAGAILCNIYEEYPGDPEGIDKYSVGIFNAVRRYFLERAAQPIDLDADTFKAFSLCNGPQGLHRRDMAGARAGEVK